MDGQLSRRCLLTKRRQSQSENGALVDFTGDGDASAVGFHDFLHNGEPKTRPGGIFRPRPISSVEALEEMRDILRFDAMAGIFDGDGDLTSNCLQTNGHGSA